MLSFSGLVVSVCKSATMKKQMGKYLESLNLFSRPLNSLTEYKLDGEGHMTVANETADHFRYIDFTHIAERLFAFIKETVDSEFILNLEFLESFDRARAAVRGVVDGLGRKEELLVTLCYQNKGKLGSKKREKHFSMLTDEEVAEIERRVQEAFADADD